MAERVTFPSTSGPRLAGVVDLPEGPVRGWAVLSHGFTLGKDSPAASRIAKQLARDGVGVLRFDNLGLGDSEGDWGDGSFSRKVEDTAAGGPLHGRRRAARSGCSSATPSAGRPSSPPRTSSTASGPWPASGRRTSRSTSSTTTTPCSSGSRPTARRSFVAGGKALTLRRHFIDDVRATDLRERIRTLKRALLVMHSPTDNTVGVRNASQIFQTARHPRSFVALEGADHLLTGRGQAARAARIISAWADPYLT